MSVARPLRSTLEQVADALPDIVMLGIGVVILAVFFKPIMSFVTSITGVIKGIGGTSATLTTTGTVGHVSSMAPQVALRTNVVNPYRPAAIPVGPYTGDRYAWYYSYGRSYTPINRFFRQMVAEGQ